MDREKVIDRLEMLRFFNQRAGRELWQDKPHDVQEMDIANADAVYADAIELLKEQEAKIEQLRRYINGFSKDAVPVVRCKDCRNGGIDTTSYPHYWCNAHSEYHKADWFCADGERKE